MISNEAIIAICGVVTLLIGQVALYMKSRDNGKIGLENKAELKDVKERAGKIEVHVNGEKSAAIAREKALQDENTLLRQMNAEKLQTANLLAQATAQALPSVSLPTPP